MFKLLAFLCLLLLAGGSGYGQEKATIARWLERVKNTTDTARVNALNELGSEYIFAGTPDSALYYSGQALNEAVQLKFDNGIIQAYKLKGNACLLLSRYPEAQNAYLKALDAAERTGDETKKIPIYLNISTVHIRQKQYEQCQNYLAKAWDIATRKKDSLRLPGILNNYATIMANTGKADSAIYYLKTSVLICNLVEKNPAIDVQQLRHYKSNALLGIGQMLAQQGDPDSFMPTLDSLWRYEDTANGILNKMRVLRILSAVAFQAGQYEKAIDLSQKALALDQAARYPDVRRELYLLLADCYTKRGIWDKAYEYLYVGSMLNDSLVNSENYRAISEMQTRYETEKKDAAIKTLNRQRKTQRIVIGLAIAAALLALCFLLVMGRSKRMQKKLFLQKEQLAAKEKAIEKIGLEKRMNELEQMALRAQMNPHFIFNSLNSVQHFILKNDADGAARYLARFARLVRQTLDNASKTVIPLSEEIKYLDSYLSLEQSRSNNAFSYTIMADEQLPAEDTFLPGMMLQPYVENCVLHGVSGLPHGHGHISISFTAANGLTCMIEDNGIGRNKAGALKLAQENVPGSKGMSISGARVALFKKIYEKEITVQVTDILNGGETVAGTRVIIQLPADLEEQPAAG